MTGLVSGLAVTGSASRVAERMKSPGSAVMSRRMVAARTRVRVRGSTT